MAQGVNAIVTYPDAGKAILPALTQATKAGVTTVPYWNKLDGTEGENFTKNLYIDWGKSGEDWANWLVKELHGKGNWVYIGGTPDNVQNLERGWTFHTGNFSGFFEPTPIVVDNVLYFSSQSAVFALDPVTGAQIWKYEAGGQVVLNNLFRQVGAHGDIYGMSPE